MKAVKNKPVFCLSDMIISFLSAYLFTGSLFLIISPSAGTNVSFAQDINIFFFAAVFLCIAVPIAVFDATHKEKNACRYCLVFSILVFSFALVSKLGSVPTYFVMLIVVAVTLYCFEKKFNPSVPHNPLSKKVSLITVTAFAVGCFAVLLTISVLRFYTYSAPNYDFGIFCNMFYNMKESGQAVTTCERDRLLSHFAVHISPVFYLLLPIYYLFPSPVTLSVMQPLLIFSSVIPLYLLAKHLKLSQNCVTFITVAFALYTPLSAGCFYDIHENCFLVPLLMWTFYFFEKGKNIPMFIFAVLVLTVKEDAFIYIAFFALYAFISRKKYLTGTALLVTAGAYFLFASYLLTKYGTGIMSSRYGNLAQDGGLLESAKTILFNPGYAIGQVLETKDGSVGKFLYLIQIFCPLACLPFMTKNFSRYLLILPIFINLLTKYTYQYDITFQYTFGICAFLFYFSLLNLSDMKKEKQENMSFFAVIAAIMLFAAIVLPKCNNYVVKFTKGAETYAQVTQALEEVLPDDAEVTASTYLIPHIADRKVIYEDEYHDTPSTEYFVLDRTRSAAQGREKMYLEAGYELIYEIEGVLEIYQNQDFAPQAAAQ